MVAFMLRRDMSCSRIFRYGAFVRFQCKSWPFQAGSRCGQIVCNPQSVFRQMAGRGRGQLGVIQEKPKKLIAPKEAHRFIVDCFGTANVPQENAVAMADMLVAADYQGHLAHGMNRMVMYMYDLCRKACDGAAVPCIIKESAGTAWVDGRHGLGAVIGNFCMDLAVQKAKNVGFGWVCCKNTNHYGIAGWYAERALRSDVIGITMCNGSPLVAPTRSKVPAVGTNPIAVGVPAGRVGDSFLLDFATSCTTMAQVEIIRLKSVQLPQNSAIGPDGQVSVDAEVVYTDGSLLPLGGLESTKGHSGYGLACVADILAGVLSGANYLTKVRKWHKVATNENPANLGQMFVAIDPKFFTDDFAERMTDFLSRLRASEPINPELPVLVAGDKERAAMKKVDETGGIEYPEELLEIFEVLASRLGVKALKLVETKDKDDNKK